MTPAGVIASYDQERSMRWRESYERPEPILNSGETHGHMEIAVRYDLITPLGLREVAGVMGSPDYRADKGLWNLDSEGLVGRALEAAYVFLAGDGVFPLARAAAFILEALALHDGAERVMHGHVEGSSGYECLPPAGLRAMAWAAAELAGLIGPFARECERIPAHVLVNGAIGALNEWFEEKGEEGTGARYLGRAALGLMDAIHAIKKWPNLQAETLRGPGCEPPPKPAKISVIPRKEEMIAKGELVIEGKMDVKWEPGDKVTEAFNAVRWSDDNGA